MMLLQTLKLFLKEDQIAGEKANSTQGMALGWLQKTVLFCLLWAIEMLWSGSWWEFSKYSHGEMGEQQLQH